MLPNGILGILANDPSMVTRFIDAHLHRCAEDQSVSFQQLESTLAALGSVTSTASEVAIHSSRSTDGSRIGVFNGVAFGDWSVEHTPHQLLSLSTSAIDSGANGMFLAAAADEQQLALLTDPWGTMPVYVFQDADSFSFSTSLQALTEACVADPFVMNGAAVSQLLAFGRTIDGQTVVPGIRRLGRATICRVRRDRGGIRISEEEYFSPKVEPSEYRGIDDDIVESFRTAVRNLHGKAGGDMVCTLSGGLDSRVIASVAAAEKWDIPFATHAVREGHDLRIAAEVAKRLQLPHQVINLPEQLPLDHRATQFLQASNGMLAFDNYHVMWAYPEYAKLGSFTMDGINSCIEGRMFLRNNANGATTRELLFKLILQSVSRPAISKYLKDKSQHENAAAEILRGLTPDPSTFASPACCADVFHAGTLLPNHGADGALLQNHFIRFLSPYLDRDYVSVISRLSERKRWAQHPQRLIVRKLSPQLAGLPRSYSDILSWPTDNPYLLRVPVAFERLYSKLHLDRLPSLYHKLSRRAPTIGSTLVAETPLLLNGRLAEYFNLPAELLPDNRAGRTYAVHEKLYPLLHFLIGERG